MTEEITIILPCYNCGENVFTPFPMFDGHTEYIYCNSCKQGIQVHLRQNTLEVEVLSSEDFIHSAVN